MRVASQKDRMLLTCGEVVTGGKEKQKEKRSKLPSKENREYLRLARSYHKHIRLLPSLIPVIHCTQDTNYD